MATADEASEPTGDAPAAVEKLTKLDVPELQARYLEVVGRPTGSSNKAYLVWKIREAQKGRIPVGPRRSARREGVTFKVLPLRMEADLVDKLDEAWNRRFQPGAAQPHGPLPQVAPRLPGQRRRERRRGHARHGSLMNQADYQKRRLIEWITAEVTRQVGRRYHVAWEALDDRSLREIQRLLRDLEHEKQMAVQQVRLCPWRMP